MAMNHEYGKETFRKGKLNGEEIKFRLVLYS